MKTLSTFLRSSDQMRLLLTGFYHLKSHYYTNASPEILITKLEENNPDFFKWGIFKALSSLQILKGNNFVCLSQFAKIFM